MARHNLSHQLTMTIELPNTLLETVLFEVGPLRSDTRQRTTWLKFAPTTSYRLRPDLVAFQQLPEDQGVVRALEHQESLVTEWMKQWLAQAFPEMVARTTWKQEHKSVKNGDMGHIVYKGTYGRDTFRLCRVSSVSPDVHSVVRTCKVKFRSQKSNETGAEY